MFKVYAWDCIMVIENRWLRRKTLRETEDYEIHRERMRKLNREKKRERAGR